MTIKEILRNTCLDRQISPLDAEILLSLVTKLSKEQILAHSERKLTKPQISKFEKSIKRRLFGEPIAYIVGKKEFFGLDFIVNNKVLIPRPETELITETVIEQLLFTKYFAPDAIIDVGTGSGNIIISIAKNIPNRIKHKINFFGVDVSADALGVAKKNAKKHKVDKEIKFVQSDLLNVFQKNNIKAENLFIVANLPYVSLALYKKNKNKLKFEPEKALLSARNGLAHYERLLREIRNIQRKHSVLHVACILEISFEQKAEIGRIIAKCLPRAKIRFGRDLAGKWRMAAFESLAR